MIDSLSPLSRRVLAVGLLILVLTTTLNFFVVPLWQSAEDVLSDLASARAREQIIRRSADAEPPPLGEKLPAGLAFRASDRGAALTLMGNSISDLSKSHQLVVENLSIGAITDPPNRMAVDFVASGSEVDIVKLIAALEQGSPTIRLESWTILAPDAVGTPAKLHARAIGIWERS